MSPILWARSLAWFITGTVDVLEYLPADHPDRAVLTTVVQNIARGLERYQDSETGLYKPAQPNSLETSASTHSTPTERPLSQA